MRVIVNRRGAGVARRAHNPEVTGSKPVAGIHLMVHRVLVHIEFIALYGHRDIEDKPAWRNGSAQGS